MKIKHLPKSHGGQVFEKEMTMLCLLARGQTSREIAGTICISMSYVYFLAALLKARFSVDTLAAVVSRAIALGIISADGELLIHLSTPK